MVNLFIAGDVVPKGILPEEFKSKGEKIFSEMKPHIAESDFSVINLEAPVIKNQATPIKKSGPCLGVAPTTIEVLKDAGFDVFTLANNHFFDQGQTGVDSTINESALYGIKTVGGGKTKDDARRFLLLEKEGKRIAIINACENEFSVADETHGGSNPLDLISMQEDIPSARKEADFVVLILHGGIEHYHCPTPRMKRWFRHFVDLGADVVINHHQHCINGYEVYHGKPIFYGLGNFYFPWGVQNRPDSWYYGFAVRLLLDKQIGFELIPYKQTTDVITIREKEEFKKEIDALCLPIQDDNLLQQSFDDYVLNQENCIKISFLPSFLRSRLFTAMARRGWLGELYTGREVITIKNKLSCESHAEIVRRMFTLLSEKEQCNH